ncbi:MAG: aminotransferase class I/II-fold pyridoxal phosphate-dependent enzyme [Gemmatimonadetes bacterium]|nr:aminotransferase class I/II-fold pyridoxal phosphate-dependent enzyme [Gemmatimonadota bacterium]
MINLRSDTVSKPTDIMRRAMAHAEVGDDYYREDPTVIALEEKAAELFGKEAAIFVFSATMSNVVSVLSHTRRGQSVILEELSHIYNNEAGFLSAFGGLTPRTVKGEKGRITPDQVEAAVFPTAVLHPQTSLLCLENTHNHAGGTCLSLDQTRALSDTARSHGMKVHLDGARIFNSSMAQGVSVRELTADADSVTVCLTKGLGCPVGAICLGSGDFVEEARRWRQAVGGGMRQAGVIAAAGIVALDTMVDRLAEDHANARLLAARLAEAGLELDCPPEEVETNIIFATIPSGLMDAEAFVEGWAREGVSVNPPKDRRIRLITHHNISADDIEAAGAAARRILGR